MSRNAKWRTQEGLQLPVHLMGTNHLRNALAMLKRFAEANTREVEVPLGGGLFYRYEQNGEDFIVNGAPVCIWIARMENELNRRAKVVARVLGRV